MQLSGAAMLALADLLLADVLLTRCVVDKMLTRQLMAVTLRDSIWAVGSATTAVLVTANDSCG